MAAQRSSSLRAEFSVPRINRLLRPLRNKCAILASSQSYSWVAAAPVTRTCGSSCAPPSLDILRDPRLVRKSSDALARQIYAVTDAYHNVVQAAMPAPTSDLDGSCRGVLSLADMCAATVGQNVQAQVANGLAALDGEIDETVEMTLSGELYESVPMHYRRWTLVAHATSVVIDSCPNHPLLMLSLLGVALSHGLLTESRTFLRSFLTALIRPSRDGVPSAITHPMYPSYLVELCEEWTRLAPEANTSAFTRRTFAAMTLETLVEHGPRQAWTCKSVTRLAQLFRTQDFECFFSFLQGLIEAITKWPRHDHDQDQVDVFSRLAKWTGVIASDFFAIGADTSVSDAEQFHSIAEIMALAFEAGIHMQFPTDDSNNYNTDTRSHQAAIVCTATFCLSAPLFSHISARKQNALLALLRDATPDSTTFSSIIARRPLVHLHSIAGHLRLHDLGALEVALWTCAVEHAEPRTDRAALMDALSDAERRFYMCTENAGEWEWEDMVGSWVRRVSPPPRKRARRESETRTLPSRAKWRRSVSPPSSSTTSRSTSVFTECAPSLLSATSSSSSISSFSTPPTPSSRFKSSFSVVVPRYTRSEGCSGRATRSTDKLRSVLADAFRTRIDLRTERRDSSRALSRCCSAWSERGEDEAWDEELQAATSPSEDDVLDMFTYDDDDPL